MKTSLLGSFVLLLAEVVIAQPIAPPSPPNYPGARRPYIPPPATPVPMRALPTPYPAPVPPAPPIPPSPNQPVNPPPATPFPLRAQPTPYPTPAPPAPPVPPGARPPYVPRGPMAIV